MACAGRIIQGDCLKVLRKMEPNSVDAIVTDPPAGIAFMGKSWDNFRRSRDRFIDWLCERMAECLRVLKPGGYALVWAIPRTSHWTATACEDAGFEVRDRISHLFGQGFPKAKSCLKPACEDWWLLRKPSKRMTDLNIDACRIGTDDVSSAAVRKPGTQRFNGQNHRPHHSGDPVPTIHGSTNGRWPANLVLSHHPECRCAGLRIVNGNGHHPKSRGKGGLGTNGHAGQNGLIERKGRESVEAWECHPDCPVGMFPQRSCGGAPKRRFSEKTNGIYFGKFASRDCPGGIGPSAGSAARFFYCAKASRSDRNDGLEDPGPQFTHGATLRKVQNTATRGNTHPTVKPCALMQWLCRLITPPGGLILDPFSGSGSTGKAAILEGFQFIGIEREPEYVKIARARIAHAAKGSARARQRATLRRHK